MYKQLIERKLPTSMKVVLLILAAAAMVHACTKEEYLSSFGESYRINVKGAAVDPGLEGEYLVAEVSYETNCIGGGSTFLSRFKEPAETGIPFSVLIASREMPMCEDSERVAPFNHTQIVAIDLTANGQANQFASFKEQQFRFVAFPPDQEYETYDLRSREHTIDKWKAAEKLSAEPESTTTGSPLAVLTGNGNGTEQQSTEELEVKSSTVSHIMTSSEL